MRTRPSAALGATLLAVAVSVTGVGAVVLATGVVPSRAGADGRVPTATVRSVPPPDVPAIPVPEPSGPADRRVGTGSSGEPQARLPTEVPAGGVARGTGEGADPDGPASLPPPADPECPGGD